MLSIRAATCSPCASKTEPSLAVVLAAVLPVLVACGGGTTAPSGDGTETAAPAVHAAYVLLASAPEDGSARPLARVIVDGASAVCPDLTGASTVPTTPRRNPDPDHFPVTACEAFVPFDETFTVAGTDRRLPAAGRSPTHLVVFGDSGCKSEDCASGPATPFDELAGAAAGTAPDLVLHTGDFNYRGTSGFRTDPPIYDAGDDAPDKPPCAKPTCQLCSAYASQNASGSEHPDTWTNWKLDLFDPAAKLMAAAPWIVTRGNHELCSRAGLGYFYFLDPSASVEAGGGGQLSCPSQDGDGPTIEHILLPEPYTVELDNLRVSVLDSANSCDEYAPEETVARYTEQLGALLASVPSGKPTWLLTHRPIWGAVNGADYFPSKTLQVALARAVDGLAEKALPADLDLVVAGHMHLFFSATFPEGGDEARPPQLVIGNSGVALETIPEPGSFDTTIDGEKALALSYSQHGYLDIPELGADGAWRGSVVEPTAGKTWAECDTANLPAASLCRPTSDD